MPTMEDENGSTQEQGVESASRDSTNEGDPLAAEAEEEEAEEEEEEAEEEEAEEEEEEAEEEEKEEGSKEAVSIAVEKVGTEIEFIAMSAKESYEEEETMEEEAEVEEEEEGEVEAEEEEPAELVAREDYPTQGSFSLDLNTASTLTETQPLKDDYSEEVAMDADPKERPQNRRLSLKRSRQHYLEDSPSIRVSYRNLTSESKKKLKEFLRQWAEWQSRNLVAAGDSKLGTLECGEEEYFPALQVGEENSLTVHFWMDKPSKQACLERLSHEIDLASSQEEEKNVPLYDRACTATLISEETTASLDGALELPEEDSRCFNCSSYSHSLKDCPRPRDNTAINNARKMHLQKRGSSTGPRVTSRYYHSSPGGKFDDLKPGVLGSETRQSLGIGEFDPPPWLNRMRELGYPPGYMEEPDEPSGITIFGTNEDDNDGAYLGEDGEITGNTKGSQKLVSAGQMTIGFPGLNAPIPKNADERKWAAPRNLSGGTRTQYPVTTMKSTDRKSLISTRFSATAVTADGVEYAGYGDGNLLSDASPVTEQDSFDRNHHVRSSPIESPAGNARKRSNEKSNTTGRYKKSNDRTTYSGTPRGGGRLTTDVSRSPYEEHHPLPPLSGSGLAGRQSSIMHSPQAYYSPQNMRMHSPQSYHSPRSGQQQTPSPGWRTSHNWDQKDDLAEARRQAWAQAHEALVASRRSETSERSSSRRRKCQHSQALESVRVKFYYIWKEQQDGKGSRMNIDLVYGDLPKIG